MSFGLKLNLGFGRHGRGGGGVFSGDNVADMHWQGADFSWQGADFTFGS